MRVPSWARTRDDTTAEWHALLDEARLITVCGSTLRAPVDKRSDAPGFRDAACAQCYARATASAPAAPQQETEDHHVRHDRRGHDDDRHVVGRA